MIHITDPVGGQVVKYVPTLTATGLTFTGSGVTYPTYNSYYVKVGKLVSFYIECSFATMTAPGTGQIKVELPSMPYNESMNHFSAWAWYNTTISPDVDPGHVVLQADHVANTKVLDLHWYGAATANPKPVNEQLFTGISPYTLTTNSKLYVNGTYIAA